MTLLFQIFFDRKSKESVRVINSQSSDVKKINLIKKEKYIGIIEDIKRNEIIKNSFKP